MHNAVSFTDMRLRKVMVTTRGSPALVAAQSRLIRVER